MGETAPRWAGGPRAGGLLGYALAILICAMWGSSFVLTKAALDSLGPMSIAFVRWAISALVLLSWLAWRRRLPLAASLARGRPFDLLWLALTGVTLFYALQNLSVFYTTATNAGILSNFTTVFMVLMAVIWLRERLALLEWLALAAAFAGAALISQGSGHFSISGPGLRGDLLMVLATVFVAAYSVGSKRLTARYPADVVTAAISLLGALLLLPLALHEGLDLALAPNVWVSMLLLGAGGGALGNLFWLHLLSYMDASRVGMFLFLVPVFSTVLAVIFLHEPITPLALAGSVLVLSGVWVMREKT